MREAISDLVKHTGDLGFITEVKVIGSADATSIEALDSDHTAIIYGRLKTPLPELSGEFGINHLGLLKGFCNFANYKTDNARFTVKRRNNDSAPEELQFNDGNGSGATFRFVNVQLLKEPRSVVQHTIAWDISLTPNPSKVKEFSQLAAILSDFEKHFGAKTRNGDLVFSIGDEGSSTHRAEMVFESGITGTLKGRIFWPSSQVLSILRLAGSDPVTMKFSNQGAMQIGIETEHGFYDYLLPSKR